MTITMNDSQIKTILELKKFLQSTCQMSFQRRSQAEAYEWIKKVLKRFKYFRLKKLEKGSVQDYIKHLTRYSPSQITRLIAAFFETEDIQPLKGKRNKFPVKYLPEELQLLAQTDELHGFPKAAALKYPLGALAKGNERFKNVCGIGVAQVYNLRRSWRYHKFTRWFKKTKSRPKHSNDNALIETKNGPIIRKWIDYAFIDQRFACDLNQSYFASFNE